MSIHDILNKIKGLNGIDNTTIVYLFVVLGVGIASFGLGRLSAVGTNIKGDIAITQTANSVSSKNITNKNYIESNTSQTTDTGIKKNYVASKHGKLYYIATCTGAKRIKPENEVWFANTSDAESAGYIASSSCK